MLSEGQIRRRDLSLSRSFTSPASISCTSPSIHFLSTTTAQVARVKLENQVHQLQSAAVAEQSAARAAAEAAQAERERAVADHAAALAAERQVSRAGTQAVVLIYRFVST